MNKKIIILFFSFLYININFAQTRYDFGFERNNSIIVKDSIGNTLSMPWVGGFNAVHFEEMDLNLDGAMDLIVFDTHGNKMTTLINNNIANTTSYSYAPEYEKLVPKCDSWIETYDYDNDGKMDIFTYVPAGIRVYRNTSTSTELKFTEITYMLNYLSEAGFYTNVFVSSVDFPSFSDVDFDGDMDILTFHVLGTYIVYYKNYSMERYGVPDSLEFKVEDNCWGKFAESQNSNAVTLNSYCLGKSSEIEPKSDIKHTGSTLLSLNLNGDTLMDLVLGDVDFFNLIGLVNGGTRDSAHIISQDTTFPSYTQPIDLVTFPLANYIDIDNDNTKELIVSPFDPSYYKPKAKNNILLYENNGTNDNPSFSYIKNSFLQDQMIDIGDASAPSLMDVDGDGLLDIVIGNYGNVDSTYLDSTWFLLKVIKNSHLSYFKNIGSITNPSFQYIDGNWQNMSALKKVALKPTFGDVNGDGKVDMILGNSDGKLIYKKNITTQGQTITFDSAQFNYQNIDVGEFSSPQLIDINGDTLLDLVIGSKSGLLSYYQNTGSANNPIFTLITDSMGNVKTTTYWHYYNGYSSPYFYYDRNDSLKAFVGSSSGLVFYYKDIRANILGTFKQDSNLIYKDLYDTLYSVVNFINEGSVLEAVNGNFRSTPIVYDFNNDGYEDLMVGNFSGGLNYYKGIIAPGVGVNETELFNPNIKVFPNPCNTEINLIVDGNELIKGIDVQVYDLSGRIIFQKKYSNPHSIKINTTNFTKGVYIIRMNMLSYRNRNSSKTIKLIRM